MVQSTDRYPPAPLATRTGPPDARPGRVSRPPRGDARTRAAVATPEPSPLRALWSMADALCDRLSRVRAAPWIVPLPLEWMLTLVAVMAWLDVAGVGDVFRDAPPSVLHAACALGPFAVIHVARLVWHPVPFFRATATGQVPVPPGTYAATCYGEYVHAYEPRHFWLRPGTLRCTRIRYGWSAGRVDVGRGFLVVRATARTVAYRAAFEGPLVRDLEVRSPGATRVRYGTATEYWRRRPAIEITTDDARIVAVLHPPTT